MFGEFFNPRSQKPLRVSELIGTFNRREPRTAEDEDEAAVKQRRRASLNLQFAPSTAVMSDTEKSEKWLKAQRRKSTSSLLSNNIENLKIQEQVKQRSIRFFYFMPNQTQCKTFFAFYLRLKN